MCFSKFWSRDQERVLFVSFTYPLHHPATTQSVHLLPHLTIHLHNLSCLPPCDEESLLFQFSSSTTISSKISSHRHLPDYLEETNYGRTSIHFPTFNNSFLVPQGSELHSEIELMERQWGKKVLSITCLTKSLFANENKNNVRSIEKAKNSFTSHRKSGEQSIRQFKGSMYGCYYHFDSAVHSVFHLCCLLLLFLYIHLQSELVTTEVF